MAITVAVPVEQLWHRVPGGTAIAVARTMARLADLDDVELRTFAAWHRRSQRNRFAPGPPPAYSRLPRPALYEAWLRLRRPALEPMVGRIDVVWAASMIVPPTSAPTVATVHDLDFLASPERSSRRGRSFFPRAFEVVRDTADLVVCPSRAVADDCGAHGIETERLRIVPWGVEAPLCDETEGRSIRLDLGLPERFALWVGTVEPRKNLRGLVEAMGHLPDLDLVVVGPDGWVVDGSDLLAPLGGRVHRLGVVDDRRLSGLYRSASVFVFPSLAEGFGLPVLEAMAHETPVVTSKATATEEVAGGAARLVDPLDSGSIAVAIEAALNRDGTTMDLIERGKDRAAKLSWSASARSYRSVFHELVTGL